MRRIKKDSERKVRVSITIVPELNKIIESISVSKLLRLQEKELKKSE
jgi:hypothetical protein